MERNLFRYIWTHSRREQLVILAIVIASLPFYFVSLDLPRFIVNDAIQGRAFTDGKTEAVLFSWKAALPDYLGGGHVTLFEGVSLSRLNYLLALSGAFLLLVVINGAFKYVINVRKGAMGERLLQRIRHDLASLMLRAGPDALRSVKPSEMATVVKDEVEPIGGFVGDAFVAPVFLGGQALTALAFIMVQSIPLGSIAAAIVLGQGVLIPRLRREQLRLSRQRQIASRALAGQVGELVEGMAAVHGHGTGRYEMARIDGRLGLLYEIRFALYKRKFAVKFLNNFLAQLTPFIFYALGGYLALRGNLDIGQLVAVIAAYRELPPPVKELIDWDQQRMDVQVKYEQIVEQFAFSAVAEEEGAARVPPADLSRGPLSADNVHVVGHGGHVLVASSTFETPLPARIGLHAEAGEAAEAFARALARQVAFSGTIRIGEVDIGAAPRAALNGSLAYVGPEPVIFHGTIRENVAYGLNRREPGEDGNPADWLDWEAAGASGPDDLDGRIVQALAVCGLDDTIYRSGLGGLVDPKTAPDLARKVVEARAEVVRRLQAGGASGLVERFEENAYNTNATLGENLLFGSASGKAARERLPSDERLRQALDQLDLSRPLADVGLRIASTMVDIFADLPPDHFLFEQFSFISAEDLPDFARIVSRLERGGEPSREEAGRLIELAFDYVEPRHRLGLLTPDLALGVLAARPLLRQRLPDGLSGMVEFFDPAGYMAHAPLRDNILFGRIAYGVPGAEGKVLDVVRGTVADLGLIGEVYRLGLSTPAGYGGRLLSPAQRAGVALARALVTRPQVLVVDDALASFGAVERAAATARLVEVTRGRTLVMVVRDVSLLEHFDTRVSWTGSALSGVEEAASEGAAVVAGAAG